MQKKASVRYELQLSVNSSHIPMKPYIVNTLGDVICGLLQSLSGAGALTSTHSIFLEMDPKADEDHRVLFELAGNEIVIKRFVQFMIRSTIDGFLSSLKGVPQNLEDLPIVIELSPL
jgi:hypothetical protein